MKQLFTSIRMAILAIITITLTGCNTANVTNGGGGGRRTTTTSVSRSVTDPAPGPVRIEPYKGSWDATEKAAAYASNNGWHGPIMFKPCKMGSNGQICDSDLDWMSEQACKRFMLGLGKGSPYCGAIWVKGSAATVAYSETFPVEEELQGNGGGNVTIITQSNHTDLGLTAVANGVFGLAGRVLERGLVQGGGCYQPQQRYSRSYCPPPQHGVQQRPQQRPQVYCPPQQQQRGQTIYRVHNYNETNSLNANNAPRGYVPSGNSRPFGNGSNNSGYGRGNPGLKYY